MRPAYPRAASNGGGRGRRLWTAILFHRAGDLHLLSDLGPILRSYVRSKRRERRWFAVSSWASVLQQLAELDPAEFDPQDMADEQLRETIPLAQRGINRLSSVMTRAVACGDGRQVQKADGIVSMKRWLIGHCRVSG